jgi:hypothetical protein
LSAPGHAAVTFQAANHSLFASASEPGPLFDDDSDSGNHTLAGYTHDLSGQRGSLDGDYASADADLTVDYSLTAAGFTVTADGGTVSRTTGPNSPGSFWAGQGGSGFNVFFQITDESMNFSLTGLIDATGSNGDANAGSSASVRLEKDGSPDIDIVFVQTDNIAGAVAVNAVGVLTPGDYQLNVDTDSLALRPQNAGSGPAADFEATFDNLALSVTVIPEPTTAAFLGIAGLTLLGRSRGRPRSCGAGKRGKTPFPPQKPFHSAAGWAALVALAGVSPDAVSSTIYTTYQNGQTLAAINTDTGTVNVIGNFGYSSTFGNAFDRDGTLYATTASSTLATVNLTTGAATVLGNLPSSAYAIDFDSAGRLYLLAWNGTLYQLNKTDGSVLATIGATGVSNTMDIAIDSQDRLYATVSNRLYRIDSTDGSVISSVALGGVNNVMGIMFDEDDVLYATDYQSGGRLYTINLTTGQAAFASALGYDSPHGGDIYVIPEPTTAAFLGLAGLTLLGRSRGRPRSCGAGKRVSREKGSDPNATNLSRKSAPHRALR